MAEAEVLAYVADVLGHRVLPVDALFSEISEVKNSPEELEEYLRSHGEHFVVENGRVGAHDRLLESGRAKAVAYFREALRLYNEPPNPIKLRSHLRQAERDVADFVNRFYPGGEFENFLSNHPDVFVVFPDDSVYLVENESVDYLERCLDECGDGCDLAELRACVSRAPRHVKDFIEGRYPGETFLQFLEENSDVFGVEEGRVYLNPDESWEMCIKV